MIDRQDQAVTAVQIENAFHTGYVVPALEDAMEELSSMLGVTWTDIVEQEMTVLAHGEPLEVRQRLVYSRQGPHRIELLEQVPGTVWASVVDGAHTGAVHHLGIWVDDFVATSKALSEAGHPCVLTVRGRDDRPAAFAYHALSSGALVELVDARMRPGFEAWFSGAPFPS